MEVQNPLFKTENKEAEEERAKALTTKAESLLMHRYEFPEWAIFFEVVGETGHRADALAMNMFKSRGHRILGFEIKASRGDWLTELKNSYKADYFFNHCDEWYIVEAKEGIVKQHELPPGWGLLTARGDRLYTKIKSDIGIKSPSREFFVRMLQKCYTTHNPQDLIIEAERRGREQGRNDYINGDSLHKDMQQKTELVDKMSEMGLCLWRYSKEQIDEIKQAMALVDKIHSGWSIKSELESIERTCQDVVKKKNECLDIIKKIKGDCDC